MFLQSLPEPNITFTPQQKSKPTTYRQKRSATNITDGNTPQGFLKKILKTFVKAGSATPSGGRGLMQSPFNKNLQSSPKNSEPINKNTFEGKTITFESNRRNLESRNVIFLSNLIYPPEARRIVVKEIVRFLCIYRLVIKLSCEQ
jgi:hypothetical protein